MRWVPLELSHVRRAVTAGHLAVNRRHGNREHHRLPTPVHGVTWAKCTASDR
jgi:hypothetical protein